MSLRILCMDMTTTTTALRNILGQSRRQLKLASTISAQNHHRLFGSRRPTHTKTQQPHSKKKHQNSSRAARHSTASLVAAATTAPSTTTTTQSPSFAAMRQHFVASAIPMVGFGFMDNFVMIQAGQYIDSTVGVTLGLATLTAAAAGQVVSDVSGVLFGGTLERFLALPTSLTAAQRQLPAVRNVGLAGAVVGVIVGCALGATTLLLVDLEARERIDKTRQLKDIVRDMMLAQQEKEMSMSGSSCTVHVVTSSHGGRGHFAFQQTRDDDDDAPRIANLPASDDRDDAVHQCAAQRRVITSQTDTTHIPVLCAPIMRPQDRQVLAVLEIERPNGFTMQDEVAFEVMARHLAIVMKHIVE